MEIKLFGKSLFEVKKSLGELLYGQGQNAVKESKYLPDFYTAFNNGNTLYGYTSISDITNSSVVTKIVEGTETKPKPEPLTPKTVYDLKMLHDQTFQLNVDPVYIDQQLADFKDKLGLIKSEEYDMARGVQEISSIIVRLENRKKYGEVKDFFEEYPYTSSSKIDEVVKAHDYLKIGQIAQFLADMPKEAVEAMKQYNEHTDAICGKQAVFYIIADKKDFEKTTKRRDPILLAQSPFGHFWNIIGAWDKEMLLLENL